MKELDARYSPSFRLVTAHFAVGLAGMLVFAALLLANAAALGGPFFQGRMLGLVHLCVLGWLLPVTLGALHQLVPVVFEVPLVSERAAWTGLVLYVPGAAGMVWHFWDFEVYRPAFVVSAGLVLAALLVDLGQLAWTVARARTRSLTGAYVLAAMVWLVAAAGLGFALACNLYRPYLDGDHLQLLRLHAHAAGLGFFGLLVMGVAFRLLEMFLLAHVDRHGFGVAALVAVNAALVSLTLAFATGIAVFGVLGTLSAAVGVAAFLLQVRRIVRARVRRHLDVAFGHTAVAFAYLGLAAVLGVILWVVPLAPALRERVTLVYGLVALPGFIGTVIVGQLHKILPFLVWFHRFSPFVGLKKVRPASELLPVRPQRVQWLAMHLGIAVLATGFLAGAAWFRIAGAALFAGATLLLARNLLVIYRSKP
jgi:hypothetical protein